MEPISNTIKKKQEALNSVNNDISNKYNTVNNDRDKYSLDRTKFIPRTEVSQLAEETATKLNDLKNFACYLGVIKKIGVEKGIRLLKSTLDDIAEKAKTKTPVKKPGAYYMWKLKTGRY